MSQGLAAARKRRAPASVTPTNMPPPPSQGIQQPQPNPAMGLTLPQVIALVDQRLVIVETFMKNMQSSENPGFGSQLNNLSIPDSNTNSLLEEINSRYDLLAEEVINLKNIVLSLQSYTMEVNKTLMEERIRILSDVMEPIENSSVSESNLVVENNNN
jgi:hypothetical protein